MPTTETAVAAVDAQLARAIGYRNTALAELAKCRMVAAELEYQLLALEVQIDRLLARRTRLCG